MLLKCQKISAAHSILCLVFITQKQRLHFVVWNTSSALEYNNLYLPGISSPQIWKRVSTAISMLLQIGGLVCLCVPVLCERE